MHDPDGHRPRYRAREVSDDDAIARFLHTQPWGILTLVDDGEPVPTPLLYVYDRDPHAIDVHLSPAGRTAALAETDPRGTFTVATMGRIIHAWEAKEFDTEYESVVALGTVRHRTEQAARRDALAAIMAKFAPRATPGEDYRAITDAEVDQTTVLRLSIDSWSAKRNEAATDDVTSEFDPEWRSA